MQKKSVGSQIWGLFSPLFVKIVVGLLAESAAVTIYIMPTIRKLIESGVTKEDLYQKTTKLAAQVMTDYGTQIAAIAAVVTIPFLFRMMRKDRSALEQQGGTLNKKVSAKKYLLIVGISIPLMVALNNILLLVNIAEYSEAYQETAQLLYTPKLPVQLLCVGLAIPIMEEILFRGLVYKRMRAQVSVKRAIFSSAMFFGLYHGNTVQMIYGAACGLLLAYLYEKYGSIKAPILTHILMNCSACVLTEIDGFTWMFQQPVRMGIITIACAFVASVMYVQISGLEEGSEEIPTATIPM